MNPQSIGKNKFDWQRLIVGVAAIVLGILAIAAWLGLGLDDSGSAWATGTFGKVSIVLAMTWLAWPQLLLLKKLPGGGFALASVLVCIVAFIARPKLLLYFVPFLVSITVLFGAIAWIQRNLLPPKR